MAKRGIGLAGAVDPRAKIFYESLFSQFQVGRATDLLCALGAEAGVHVPSLRVILNAALGEACRYQGLLDSALASLDPVTVEFAADEAQGALSIQFTVDEANELSPRLAESIFSEQLPARGLVFKVDPETRRAEISCFVPLDLGPDQRPEGLAEREAPRFELISGFGEGGEDSSGPGQEDQDDPEIEYVELGDVEYEKLVQAPGATGSASDSAADPTKKIIEAARGPAAAESERVSEILASALSEKDKAAAIATALPPEKLVELLERNLTDKELASLVAAAEPERIGKILAQKLERKELRRLVSEALPEAEKARAIAETLPPEELSGILTQNLDVVEKAQIVAKADPARSAEILRKNVSEQQLAQVLASGLTDEERAGILVEGLPAEETAKLLADELSPAEKARAISKGNPKLAAKLIRGGASEEKTAELLRENVPEEEQGALLSEGLTREEISEVIREHLAGPPGESSGKDAIPEKEKAKLIAQANPQLLAEAIPKEELARLVKGAMTEEELARVVTGGLSEEELAQIVKGSSTPEELQQLVRFARQSMPEEELIRTVKGALDPGQLAGFAARAIQDPEICKAVLSSLSPAEITQSLKKTAPQRLALAAQAEAAKMSDDQLIEIISSGLPREEYAKMVASAIPRAEFSRILTEGLPPQEMARSLYEGLPKEKFAQLLAASVPKQELGQSLASLQLDESLRLAPLSPFSPVSSAAFGPTQERLEPAQMATLLAPELTQRQALSVLSTILPQAAAESVFTGDIPDEEIIEALKPHLPTPELASRVAAQLRKAQAAPSDPPSAPQDEIRKQTPPPRPAPSTEPVISSSTLQAPSGDDSAPPFDQRKADEQKALLEKSFQTRLGAVQKSVEFYLARARSLETQLRASEEAKRSAQRETKAAQIQLETLLDKSGHQIDPEISPEISPESSPGISPENPLEVPREPARAQTGPPAHASSHAKSDPRPNEAIQPEPKPQPRSSLGLEAKPSSSPKPAMDSKGAPDPGSIASDARAKRDQEALKFFQKKAREFEQELRKTEGEVRRLNAEHAKDLLRQSKQPARASAIANPLAGAAPTPAPETHSDLAHASKSDPAPSPTSSQASGQVEGLQDKVRQLELKFRIVEEEKERLRQQLKRATLKTPAPIIGDEISEKIIADQGPDTLLGTRPGPRPGSVESSAEAAQFKAPAASAENVENREAEETGETVESSETGESLESPVPRASTDEGAEEAQLEANGLDVERGFNGIVKTVERLKEDVHEAHARRTVDGLMTAVMQEKAKLMEASREMVKSLRQKEFSFKNQEAMLTESLKQVRGVAEQRQAAIDRLKQQMFDLQQRMDRSAQSQAVANEVQLRMKYEQSQRQIELLNREIEKANRRLQQAPQTQGNNLAQERALAEMRKQVENSVRAVTAKKQELETAKAQLNERDRREDQYKRQIMKLQGELLALRGTGKKAS